MQILFVHANDIYRALLLVVAILAIMVVGDMIVFSPPGGIPLGIPQPVWALLDAPVHWLLALAVVSPLFAHPVIHRDLWLWLVITSMAAVLIDLDHFIAAGSLSLEDVGSLENRPPAHSLLFAVAMGLVTWLISRQPLAGLLIFGALLSHVIRDASHGTVPFWWPWPSAVSISIPVYYAIHVMMGLAALWLVGRTPHMTWMDWVLAWFNR